MATVYRVELDYTILQANSFVADVEGAESQEAALVEAERRFRQEVARRLQPLDHPTILRRYVERLNLSPSGYHRGWGRSLSEGLSPELASIPD